jgi:hypothetical protein
LISLWKWLEFATFIGTAGIDIYKPKNFDGTAENAVTGGM